MGHMSSAWAWPDGDTPPIATIAGFDTRLSAPVSVVVDRDGLVVAVDLNRLRVFAYDTSGDVAPVKVLGDSGTGIAGPSAVALDEAGNLYVANAIDNSVSVFPRGWTSGQSPTKVLKGGATGLASPVAIAFHPDGRMAVANRPGVDSKVTMYAADWADGNTAPTKTLQGASTALDGLRGLAFDSVGRMYAANQSGDTVTRYAAEWPTGNTPPQRILAGASTGLADPIGILLDSEDRLYVSNQSADSVSVFPDDWGTGDAAPLKTLVGAATQLDGPEGMTLTDDEALVVANASGASVDTYPTSRQTIDFPAIGDRSVVNSPVALVATATSGLPVTFTSQTPAVCALAGTHLQLLTVGTCTVHAAQAGDEPDWDPAVPVTQSFQVTAGPDPTPTPSPSPTPTPTEKTVLKVNSRSGPVPVGERSVLVRSVRSDGEVRDVRASCRVDGRRVGAPLNKRWCHITVRQGASGAQAVSRIPVRVTAEPTCNDSVRIAVVIVARRDAAARATWRGQWRVSPRPDTPCRTRGTG